MIHKDLEIETVLSLETKEDISVVATGRGTARLTMITVAQQMPRYEVSSNIDGSKIGYDFDAFELPAAIDTFNVYSARLLRA